MTTKTISFQRSAGLLILLTSWLPLQLAAMPLNEAITLALERDAGLHALLARADARDEYAFAAGALPDPEFFLGAAGLPLNNPLDADMMTMYMIGIRQQLPPGNSRRLSGDRARTQGQTLRAQQQQRKLEISASVRSAWLDWVTASASMAVAEQGLGTFTELLELTEARYRAGTGRQRDVDQARLERSLRARQVLDAQTRVERAASDLARWTGQVPDMAAPAQPHWSDKGSYDELVERLEDHPALAADLLQIEAGRISADLERQSYKPMWMVEGGYGHQRGSDPMGMGRQPDRLFAMVSMSLPLFPGNRQDRRVAAAEAEMDALVHQRTTRLQEWQGRLRSALTRLNNQQRRLDLIEDIILPDAELTVASTLTAYRRDQASFDELVRARLARIEQQQALIDTRFEWLLARSALAYLIAEELQ
ncbi:MAG: TolC family protein [Wenzhouxiangella sp.]|nr:TolC family protein [Wenzhouxiangella sp.]MCH8478143.1 TolC family protein [Wenzhouxiangella sp.]TVR98274.1 MAG: TolC family protein [Wenzhouxiangellaceae bacterium]